MAPLVLTNARILAGQADMSGLSNMVELEYEAEEKETTTFGPGGHRTRIGGLRSASIKSGGLWDAGTPALPDDRLFADVGVGGVPMTVTPTGATVGDVAYFTTVMRPKYMFGDQIGEVLPFESEALSDRTLVRGEVADNQARTTTGTTAVRTLVAPAAGTRVYAVIHVLTVTGTTPSLTVTLQGDNAVGFPSPATVATGAAITAAGSQILVGAYGVTADSFYRLSYVITGTTPSFLVIASIGIGP